MSAAHAAGVLNTVLNWFGWELARSSKYPPRKLWEEDCVFLSAWEEVRQRSLLRAESAFELYQWARHVEQLAGEVAELGVYRGGSARLLAIVTAGTGKRIHLFDTFVGLPKPTPGLDIYQKGHFGDVTCQEVTAYLQDIPNVHVHPGRFPETARIIANVRFSFVHVDVDLYRSVRDACEFFYPRLNPGGVIVFDDYGFVKTPGAKLAVDEFFAGRPEKPCYLPTGQAVLVRHASA